MAKQHEIELVLDKNLHVETSINKDDIIFLDPRKAPFELYGFCAAESNTEYKRLPDAVAEKANEGVKSTYKNTAGGRIRFSTNRCYAPYRLVGI